MYLKSIEVQGFKSFANKINFEFHNGITGIVGPNGSGKSNVADAVRWVLGEQRIKQLRGAKMEDVIFAGTENRKPLGYAYVAITLDNSDHSLAIDFDEVTVSRRLFRSGESEYLLNGTVCRLKDINELFYDTGIGKEGYSIIGQGQIDKILSGKPEERRELFDEAAGIVKYKRRKAMTQKKLEDEQANLVRVNDILTELEKQVKPLENQSEKAKIYLKLKDELKTNDINMFLLEVENVKEKIAGIEEKKAIADNDYKETNEIFDKTKSEYEQLENKIETITIKIDEKKNELNKIELVKEKYSGEINLINEQINSAKQSDSHIKERIEQINKRIEELNKEKEGFIKEKQNLSDTLKNADNIRKGEYDKLAVITDSIEAIISEIEEAKNEIIELLNQKSAIKSKIQRYDTMLEQINIRRAEINSKLIKFSSDKDSQNKIIEDLNEEFEKINTQIIDLNNVRDEINDNISKCSENLTGLEKKSKELLVEYQRDKSRLESLKNITERYEGYGNSIRKIMEIKDNKKGVIGVVADIIKVDKEYEIAIETALGGSIQNVVTDTENTAKELIEYLKKNKFGRATFLPLSSIANRTGFGNEKVLSEKGVLGLACDLVHIKKEYEAIAKYLLGRIVVVDHIDNALVLARKYGYTLRIVTLEGELLNAGGSMSGGAFKNSSNLLGRRREIEEIENNISLNKEKSQKCDEDIKVNQAELMKLNDELEKVKAVLQQQYLLQNTVKLNLNQANEKQQELQSSFEDFKKESSEIGIQITDIKENNNELNNELKTYEDLNQALEEKIKELNISLEEEKKKESAQNEKVDGMKLEFMEMNQKITFISENIKRIDNEIATQNEELVSINSNAKDSGKFIDKKLKEIESLNASIKNATETFDRFSEEIQKFNQEKDSMQREHKDFFSKREALSEKMNQLDKEIFRLNSQKEKLEEQQDNQMNYMWNEYELTYNMAIELKNEEYNNLSEIKKTISSLKAKIKELGDVNVNAIEEFKEVNERYQFLKTQHDDLVEAEKSLLTIISELDKGMRAQFTEKFAIIRAEFDKVFKELFGGGKGTIELNEEEDILEAGITIISQPPGKKLQNMMQLSGGEKALTAIALLFAIQNLKPSPFCLLDEIEAALDDSNVSRYAKYLHKLTKYTQFIVITHRKGTMEAADRLYGITMQEKGVSTLVSVDLLDSELTN
ncbi:MAG: chromosome segregation protein SMC [Lachnospiraceae bacterium]|nr:chromosome segregation protein SMC [Lachnospiraceae bacterium]